jgi:hypothetical protein
MPPQPAGAFYGCVEQRASTSLQPRGPNCPSVDTVTARASRTLAETAVYLGHTRCDVDSGYYDGPEWRDSTQVI